MRNDSVKKTLLVAALVCVVCSIMVSATAVTLRPLQKLNSELDRKRNILAAASLLAEGIDIEQVFRDKIEARLVDLAGGTLLEGDLPEDYDQRKVERDPNQSVAVDPTQDFAGIRRRAKQAPIYFVKDGAEINKLILPIYGQGLWSTMYGFIALDKDTKTILGITFYDHGETPGLGGEIDNVRWKESWIGKLAFNESWRPVIEVIKGAVDMSRPNAKHQIDGISGATITARGVTYAVQYWLSENAYGNFLSNFRKGTPDDQ